MADAVEENGYTLDEYIEGIEQRELEADLVLGGDEGKECTYNRGYMKRQAVFSCLTCVPDGNAAVCTACSLSCHDGHEVVELWTKRKLRCDCGNAKFGEFYCKLCPNKEPENADNSYNQNFKGSYCICGRPYPDSDAEEQIEMMQCCICEDWFHENHIGLDTSEKIPKDEEGEPLYDEFICQNCTPTCSFLKLYSANIWATSKQKNVSIESSVEGNVLEHGSTCTNADNGNGPVKSLRSHSESVSDVKDSLHGENITKQLGLEKVKASHDDVASSFNCSSSECILGLDLNASSIALEENKPMFLSKNWRNLLCRCITCNNFYKKMGIDYLIDKDDSLQEYEKLGTEKWEEKLQKREGDDLSFLNGLGHIQKIEFVNGINDLKNEFASFLESFDSSKVITSADVEGVFENLRKKKKQRIL